MLLIQVSLCYILKHLEDCKAWYVHIYYTWCDIILIFKMHRRTRLTTRSSIHSLKIQMTSHPCNKYEHTTLSYLLSVNYLPEITGISYRQPYFIRVWKLCTDMQLLKAYQNTKRNLQKSDFWRHNDVITKNNGKIQRNLSNDISFER